MGKNITVLNYANNSFKTIGGGVNLNLNNSFKFIDYKFQYFIEMDKWFGWKKLFMSEVVDNYQDIDWVFLDNWGALFMDWFKERFNYTDLKFNKSIKSNVKLLLFVEDNNNNIFQINCAFSNSEYLSKFFNWDFWKIFKLSSEYIEKGNYSFYILKPILDNVNFTSIHSKSDIINYISQYNEKYKNYNISLSDDEIEEKVVEEIVESKNVCEELNSNSIINNLVEIDDMGFWLNVNGVSYEIYEGRIVKSEEIEWIENYKQKFLYNNISIYG